MSQIREQLMRQKRSARGDAEYHGRPARLWTVETEAVLYGPAKKDVGGRKYGCPGHALRLRLIFLRLCIKQDKVLARRRQAGRPAPSPPAPLPVGIGIYTIGVFV